MDENLWILLQERTSVFQEGKSCSYRSDDADRQAEGVVELEALGSHQDIGCADTGHEDGRQIGNDPQLPGTKHIDRQGPQREDRESLVGPREIAPEDVESIRIQRDLTKYVNNILPKIAENFFPDYYKGLLEAYELPKGKCKVTLAETDGRYDNEDGGIDITIPFQMIKLPIMFLEPLMLGSYVLEGSITEKRLKRIRNFEVDGYTTGYADYKLLTSKFKRDYLEDKYGRALFKTVIEEWNIIRGGQI